MEVNTAVYNALTSNTDVTSLLATYAGAPAVFASWPAPTDAERPYILLMEAADSPWDEAVTLGRDVSMSVSCYADANSGKLIEQIKEAVRATLHRAQLTVPGARFVKSTCRGIQIAPTDQTLSGRTLTFQIQAMES